jgi:hypothetical protein
VSTALPTRTRVLMKADVLSADLTWCECDVTDPTILDMHMNLLLADDGRARLLH